MSAFENMLADIGGIGNAAGVKGDGPGGLNALQRASLSPEQSSDYTQKTALSQLAQTPEFQNLSPADQQAKILQVTGDPAVAQKVSALSHLAKLPIDNPRAMVGQSVQTGSMTPAEGITALSNPTLQLGALNQLNAGLSAPQPAAQPATAAPASSPAPVQPAAVAPPKQSGVDYNYLNQAKQLSPAAGLMAENMIAGVFNPESGKGENDPVYNAALMIARKADPSFTPQSLIGRPAMVKNSTSGKMYNDSVNINSVVGHLYDLNEAAPLLQNGDHGPAWNTPVNGLIKGFNVGNAQGMQQYESILSRAAPELNKFYVGGEGDTAGREASGDAFKSNLPQSTIQNNVKTQFGLLKSKAGALQNEYNDTMGNAGNKKIIAPMAEALMNDLDGKPLTPDQQQMVNAHRAESNLPPKTWGPQGAQAKPAAPSRDELIAEAKRRGFK